jgi:hypothetical protein
MPRDGQFVTGPGGGPVTLPHLTLLGGSTCGLEYSPGAGMFPA